MAAMREMESEARMCAFAPASSVQKRIEKVMDVQIQKETHERRIPPPSATTGSAAPSSACSARRRGHHGVQAIANSQNTSPNVVVLGIAEALFATAIGPCSAIPATTFLNMHNSPTRKIGEAGELRG